MHEWLSGGASPCQGEGRGFESRLVLFYCPKFLVKSSGFGILCVWKFVDSCRHLLFCLHGVFNGDDYKRKSAYNAFEMRV